MLEGICEKYDSLLSAAKGNVSVVVTSAQPLEKATETKLMALLRASPKLVGEGQTPVIESKVQNNADGYRLMQRFLEG